MKLTTLLLIIALIQASAKSYSQITLKEKNAPIEKIFNEIEVQTGYNFIYDENALQVKTITVDVHNVTLEEALKACFKDVPVTYEIVKKNILLQPKEPSLLDQIKDKIKAELAQVTVTGRVTNELGEPMIGVTVKIKGTNNATATDAKGAYTLNVPDDKTIISFSYVGYETQELQAKDIPPGSAIILKAAPQSLREVVIDKGYYREKNELTTGDVTTVTAKEIEEQPVSDPIIALEGRVPGMQISQKSGMPGASYTIFIRGQNSMANGNNPLYIVDGVPYPSMSLTTPYNKNGAYGTPGGPAQPNSQGNGLSPFNSLNPSDIESIEVLKDADATAIYGSRGANGVVLITTKKGKAGTTRVDLNFDSGEGKVTRMMPLLNTQQYLTMRHEAFKNDGVLPSASDYDVNGTWDTTRYTNWEKLLIGNTAHFTNGNVSISGGTANTQFVLGGGYSNQTTVFPGNYQDQKSSVHLSLNHTSTNQKFHALFTAQYVQDNNVLPMTDFTSLTKSLAPDAPALYDANGNLNWQNGTWVNPLSYTLESATATTNNLVSSLNLGYNLLPNLKISANAGYTRMEMDQSNQFPSTAYYNPTSPNPNERTNYLSTGSTDTWIIEPQADYNRNIGEGKLDVLIGSSIQQNIYSSTGFLGEGFTSDALIGNISNAPTLLNEGSGYFDYRRNAIYARLNYNWKDKYIINATADRDGSSRFGPGKQFGNFGAIGAAWIFTKEKFVENAVPFLSFGKLRVSYGTTGSDQIPDYKYLSTYSISGNYQGSSGLVPTQITNPYFAWEVDNKLESGIDLGFFENRINIDANYYRNRTANQLVLEPLPDQDGFSSIQTNLPAVVQNTGVELMLNTINVKSRQFNWSSSFNLSIPRNKLVSFPGLASNSSYSGTYTIGQPIQGAVKQYNFTGVDPQTGVYTFQDMDHNGILNSADKQSVFIGQRYYGGFSNSFSYKNLHLDILFAFANQTGRSYQNSFNAPGGGVGNQPIYVLGRWQQPGDQTTIEKFTTGAGLSTSAVLAANNAINSNATVVDASFIRLKNVSLSYTLPHSWQQALRLQDTRIYLQAQNLLTFTGYQGFDPETQGLSLPPLRMISLGLRTSL